MAVGLGLLGRGSARTTGKLWGAHVLGAALAGAVVGGLLGGIGMLLGAAAWQAWIITGATVLALGITVLVRQVKLGRQRQVPRRLASRLSLTPVYAFWGVLLGCGIATPIFYTTFLVLSGAQVTAGVALGIASGAVFGAVRQTTALVPVFRQFDPARTMGLLETLRPTARRLNLGLIVVGGALLVLTSLT